MISVPPTQPPAAPEGEVSALREAIRTLHDLARGHDYADARELAAGEDAIGEVFDLLSAAREHVRVVEGEREEWRARALSNAEQCDRNWAEACLAVSRAESAEAALAELRAGIEALADDFASNVDWSNGRSNYGDNEAWESAARQVRALLGGAS